MPKSIITPITADEQIQRFTLAVDLLGGQRAAARAMGCNERTIRSLLSGNRDLHAGWLADTAKALRQREAECRATERAIDPLFHGNLTQEQQDAAKQPSRRSHGPSVKVKDPNILCHACNARAVDGHAEDCPNAMEPWPVIDAEIADPGDDALAAGEL